MNGRVLALSGGVGGAKLALGLARVLDAGRLTVVANTGDDFVHLGLSVSPDVDTLVYTLAGLADPERGWGHRDETWGFMEALARLGGETWFRLGDRDLAMHVERTHRLAAGEPLSAVTDHVRRRLGIAAAIVPMSDDPVRTRLDTDCGRLDLQDYFVRRRCEPVVHGIVYQGAETARPAQAWMQLLADESLRAVVICPSNPLLSIDPILALPGVRAALAACTAPVIAVSPLIGGRALKGPTARLIRELGEEVGAGGIARRYAGLIDVLLVDAGDLPSGPRADIEWLAAPILMDTLQDRERLAGAVLAAAGRMAGR